MNRDANDSGRTPWWVPVTIAATVLLVVGVVLALVADDGSDMPAVDSPEAEFARDMAFHHAQAVEMAELIRFRTDDEILATVATDIVLTQQSQIGRMQGWLDAWGLRTAGADGSMTMPGMAARAEINQLSALPVDEAEVLFLRLMIRHHEGGIEMAEAVLAQTDRTEVERLAKAMVDAQRVEITAMEDMLAERGAGSDPA